MLHTPVFASLRCGGVGKRRNAGNGSGEPVWKMINRAHSGCDTSSTKHLANAMNTMVAAKCVPPKVGGFDLANWKTLCTMPLLAR